MIRLLALLLLASWAMSSEDGGWVDVKVAEGVHRAPQMPKAAKAPKGATKGSTAKGTAATPIGYGPPLMALFDGDARCFNASRTAFDRGEDEGQSAADAVVARFCPRYNVTVEGGGPAAGTYGIAGYRTEPTGDAAAAGEKWRRGRRKARLEVRQALWGAKRPRFFKRMLMGGTYRLKRS